MFEYIDLQLDIITQDSQNPAEIAQMFIAFYIVFIPT